MDLGPRYRYLRELGRGGVGRVLLVEDRHLNRHVAFKLLEESAADSDELKTFQEEFALLCELSHPGIARAYDFGYLGQRAYFTCEFIDGQPLDSLRGAEELLLFARGIAEALDFLHSSEILHLDVKPSNIILHRRPVLIDFGLYRRGSAAAPPGGCFETRSAGRSQDGVLKQPPVIRGSLPYMAPEYFQGRTLGPWTDVYALGATLYRAVTGRLPRHHLEADVATLAEPRSWLPAPLPPSRFCHGLSRDLDSILLRCLAMEPAARYGTAGELLHALERLAGTSPRVAPPQPSALHTLGRRGELAAVDLFLKRILSAESPKTEQVPAALLVTAPAGMGQSHLFREIKIRAQTRGLPFYLETGYPGRPAPPGSLLRCLSSHLEGEQRSRWDAFLSRLRLPASTTREETSEGERRFRRATELARVVRGLRQPLLLAVDGLQFLDEISIALVVDLIRIVKEPASGQRPVVGVVVGYREEGTSAPLLRTLTESFLKADSASIVHLKPLGPKESLRLHQLAKTPRSGAGRQTEHTEGLTLLQETGGCPARIVALARGARPGPKSNTRKATVRAIETEPTTFPREARGLLLSLGLLSRPASAAEIARLTGRSRGSVSRVIRELKRAGHVLEVALAPGRSGWVGGPVSRELTANASPAERRRVHREIARELVKRASGCEDPALFEAVRHFSAAGERFAFVKWGLQVARYLKSTYQNRAALGLFEEILESLSRDRHRLRIELTLDLAELQARVGNLDRGIVLLREILPRSRKVSGAWEARVLLRLATLHSRRGDLRRGDALFREGFENVREGRQKLSRRERLYFVNERASMKTFLGEYPEAVELCQEGLRLAGRRRSHEIREVALNLYATRANVALRTFDYDSAIQDFETALEMAEAIGSVGNQAVILNNLGIVYSQCDRYAEAIRTLEEAEVACQRVDDGPSLTFIYGNLAVLHAKTGQFSSMEKALTDAEQLRGGAITREQGSGAEIKIARRQELFLDHHGGLALLYRGRFGEARKRLEAAAGTGEAMGDHLLATFDEVFRAEALAFEGAYSEGIGILESLLRRDLPPEVRRMALARLALLQAMCARTSEVSPLAASHAELAPGRSIPFLEAWDSLYLGWAQSLAGHHEQALDLLLPAESYFRQHDLDPAASLARWIQAEACLLRGEAERGLELLDGDTSDGNDLTAVLRPLLKARLLMAIASPEDWTTCADCLAEAGAALVGNSLPEWALRLDLLRAHLQQEGEQARVMVDSQRHDLAARLPAGRRSAYLANGHWTAWTANLPETPFRRATAPSRSSSGAEGKRTDGDAEGGSTSTKTVALHRSASRLRSTLVTKSRAMRRVVRLLDRLRTTDVPVLIQGETGTGKELIARVLHAESQRRDGPFLVVDCATIPPELLESELFGARAGAFTSLDADRPGLLERARGGTVLVDEIAGATTEVQAKLLRVLSEGTFRPLGASSEARADVRFLFASARDLEVETKRGRFRSDILHRIRVVSVRLPPLRERPEDLPGLVEKFLREEREPPPKLSPGAVDRLRQRPWPGNVRELRNSISRLCLEESGDIHAAAVDRVLTESKSTMLFPRNLLAQEDLPALKDRLERDYIVYHLRRLGGDTSALSQFLGVSRKQFYRRCQRLGVHLRAERRKL